MRGRDVRLFIAVQAAERLDTTRVTDAVAGLGKVSVVPPDKHHVTLAFLGETPEDRIADAAEAVRAGVTGIEPQNGVVQGLGAFPRPDRARILYADVVGTRLTEMAARIRSELSQRSLSFDGKEFKPHVTLARLKSPRDISVLIRDNPHTQYGPFPVHEVQVIASTLTPRGPEYDTLARVLLEMQG